MKSDNLAEHVLRSLGFAVEKIKASDVVKRPDFKIAFGQASAIVEAKLRESDPAEVKRREEILAAGSVYASDHALGRNETISGIVKKGADQLAAGDDIGCEFRILLVIADCINAMTVRDQLMDTLYGRTQIIELGKLPVQYKPCFFIETAIFSGGNTSMPPLPGTCTR